ncbi:hypothetical protein [Kamptonema formosum]|uniref:hypothetical protein n=1 Tax=Kamptonema formosum TaxID=331992 RepID=UPI00034DAD37|nr:hypothetical protein [Oscillatoria sp. PCC 10802]
MERKSLAVANPPQIRERGSQGSRPSPHNVKKCGEVYILIAILRSAVQLAGSGMVGWLIRT